MRRTALYLGGLILATSAALATAAPVQATPAECRDIVGYGTRIILVTELEMVDWDDPYIYGGYAYPSYATYDRFYRHRSFYGHRPQYGNNSSYRASNSYNTTTTTDSYNTTTTTSGSYNTTTYNSSLVSVGGNPLLCGLL
ncbi:hypothetical protein [Actinoplanes couchii]|uniref:Uncharacterized protein n=1 Tax=Actinoplanes couchii TaxID=403638 RepID=A0ABQ3X0T7_9ACTN|nr:hypothetical protein [Actinoplanes couchii]MDR6316526.1 hypothetical protein [Actinoplanes couchii]GID52141.1 hypothetical protein Aco03nite_005450 [Actinoplanes couchii]